MADAEAVLTTPYTYEVAKRQVNYFATGNLEPPVVFPQEAGWGTFIVLNLLDNTDTVVATHRYVIPDAQVSVDSFLTALDTVLAGETGGAKRRANFRILTWMLNNGILTDISSVTP